MPKVVPSQIVEFIEARFPKTVTEPNRPFDCGYHSAGMLSAVLGLIDQLPPSLMPTVTSNSILLLEAYQEIKNGLALWNSGTANALIYEITCIRDGSSLNPVTVIRNVLKECPDENISIPPEELLFLDDPDFRDTISQDIGSANQALSNAEWKAATVLAGSVIEALLLNAINVLRDNSPKDYDTATDRAISDLKIGKQLSDKPKGKPNSWTFEQCIFVALAANTVSENTAKECLLTKNYRNLIHQGRTERKNQKCDRGTALVAIAAMEHVIKELRDKRV